MNIDLNTFGSNRSSEILCEKLNKLDNEKVCKIVTRCLIGFNSGSKEIMKMDHYTQTFLIMWRDKQINHINGRKEVPDIIKNYTCNVIHSKYRKVLKEIRNK